ncbi:hypothetical protein Tco_1281261 [Tanacetum coccineum]
MVRLRSSSSPTLLPEYSTRDFTISTSLFQLEKPVYTSLTLISDTKLNKVDPVPKVDDVSLVDEVFDGTFSGDGEEDFVMGESVVVSSSSLDRSIKSCLGGIMVSLIFLERLEEEACVDAMKVEEK